MSLSDAIQTPYIHMSKFCEECGADLAADTVFCEGCGQKVAKVSQPAVSPASQRPALSGYTAAASTGTRAAAPGPTSTQSRSARTGSSAEKGQITPFAFSDGNLYPSYLIATARLEPQLRIRTVNEEVLGDPYGWFGLTIISPRFGSKVRVGVEANDYMKATAPVEYTLKDSGKAYLILPEVEWEYKKLGQVDQVIPLTVTMTVEFIGVAQYGQQQNNQVRQTLQMRSVNDCLFVYTDALGRMKPFENLWAAYVNEKHPRIENILKEARDIAGLEMFAGYQTGDPEDVVRQVNAVWEAMRARDTFYSSITQTAMPDADGFYSQHVRFLDDCLDHSQANCADGSVLFASILRNIDLNTYLILVPGHMYFAFDVHKYWRWQAGTEYPETCRVMHNGRLFSSKSAHEAGEGNAPGLDFSLWDEDFPTHFLETTLMGNEESGDFESAVAAGAFTFASKREQFVQGKDPQYQVISIDHAREQGFLPIAREEKS